MKNLLGLARILSLDVALGALASANMAVCWLGLEMPPAFWWTLPLSVWVIYTADHLLDAHRLKGRSHTPRHLFHYTHFKELSGLFLLGAGMCVFLVPFLLPLPIFLFGLGMGVFTLIHFLLVKWVGNRTSWFFLKELGVGLIYVMGVWGGALIYKESSITLLDSLFLFQFFILAMINLLSFSMYEIETDEKDGHTSFVRAIGKKATQKVILCLSSLCLISSCGVYLQSPGKMGIWVQGILLLMLAILSWVAWDEDRFKAGEAYRAWADAVFIFPVIILFIC